MFTRSLTLSVTFALSLPTPALAQFGSLFKPKSPTTTAAAKPAGCDPNKPKSMGSRFMGNVLGSMAGSTLGRTGIGRFLPIPEVSGMLTDAIACRLRPQEQKQAADATATATRGGVVGRTSSWTSAERPGVSGSSTVAGKERLADGTTCMSVRDVAIVEGEETTVSKRMCRAPGAAGYTLAA